MCCSPLTMMNYEMQCNWSRSRSREPWQADCDCSVIVSNVSREWRCVCHVLFILPRPNSDFASTITSSLMNSIGYWFFSSSSSCCRITCLHLPVGSKWLYVGTEKGNIHVVQIETFALSGYLINWNKAIEVWVYSWGSTVFVTFYSSIALSTRGRDILVGNSMVQDIGEV